MATSAGISVKNAEHYTWRDACEGGHLVKSRELSIIEERMPPHTAERRHFHTRADQFFYVLSGEAEMELDGQLVTLTAHSGIFIEHGRTHKIHNNSSEDVTFLVISRPSTRGDRQEVE